MRKRLVGQSLWRGLRNARRHPPIYTKFSSQVKAMPNCLNDPSAYFKGDEPSPKGYGFCAHAEPEDRVRIGTDGEYWVVQRDKNGRKAWRRLANSGSVKKAKKQTSAKKAVPGSRTKSPAGRGYPAKDEKIGKRRKGVDGKFWKVAKTASGGKTWKSV